MPAEQGVLRSRGSRGAGQLLLVPPVPLPPPPPPLSFGAGALGFSAAGSPRWFPSRCCGRLGLSFSGFLRRSGAGEPPSGAQPACSRTLGWAPGTTPVSAGGPASQPLPRLQAGGGPAACPAGLIPSLPVLPAIRALRSPLTSSLPACLSPRCWPSHLGPPPSETNTPNR